MDAPADDTTLEFEGSQAPGSISSPVHQASTPPPQVLPMSDISAASITISSHFQTYHWSQTQEVGPHSQQCT